MNVFFSARRSAWFMTAIFLISSLSSCIREPASSVDQDKIFVEYELFYDQDADKTYARATFRFSNATGTKLELDGDGKITFNNDPLTFNPGLAYYEKEYPGLLGSGAFFFQDLDNNTFTNTVEIHSIGLPASLDSISRAGAFELFWTGDALTSGEIAGVSLNNQNAINPQLFAQNNPGSNSIVLSKDKLNVLLAGPATLVIDRRYLPAVQQASSAGALLTGRYQATKKSVVLY